MVRPLPRQRRCGRTVLFCLAGALLCLAPGRLDTQGTHHPPVLMQGEDLVYNVRYGPFDLGQIRMRTYAPERKGGVTIYNARADINSYPKVPLVDLHAIFESKIDSAAFSRWFVGKMKDGDHWNTTRHRYDYARGKVLWEKGPNDSVVTQRDSIPMSGPTQDGLSLFFYARERLPYRQKVNVPIVVNEQMVTTYLDFLCERGSVEVDAVDHPIDVLRFEGNAQFTGIFGLTGDFEGWFSNDDARVPIMAKMKVILGSVTIELMQWNRAGWSPPRAQE